MADAMLCLPRPPLSEDRRRRGSRLSLSARKRLAPGSSRKLHVASGFSFGSRVFEVENEVYGLVLPSEHASGFSSGSFFLLFCCHTCILVGGLAACELGDHRVRCRPPGRCTQAPHTRPLLPVPGDTCHSHCHWALHPGSHVSPVLCVCMSTAGKGPAATRAGTSGSKVGSKIPTPKGGLSKSSSRTYTKR